LLLQAEYDFTRANDTQVNIEKALIKITHALTINKSVFWNILTLANIRKLQIKLSLDNDSRPEHSFQSIHQLYQESIEINAKFAPSYLNIAQLYYVELIQSKNIKSKKLIIDKALKVLDKAIMIDSQTALAYLLKAEFLKYAKISNIHIISNISSEELIKQANAINPHVALYY